MGNNQISDITRKFEEKYPLRRVVYAADCGSRSFGWSHSGSDYDVHIVYVHRDFEFYIKLLQQPREHMADQFFTEDGIEVNIMGYDLGYFFRLFVRSNPCVNIMFITPTQFFFRGYENTFDKSSIQKEFLDQYNLSTVFNSYIRLIRENFKKHVLGREHVRVKSYIYLVHHMLFLKHIHKNFAYYEEKKEFPPIEFEKLFSDLECVDYVRKEINELIDLKKKYNEEEEREKKEFDHLKGTVRLFSKRRKVLEVWLIISRRKLRDFIKKRKGMVMKSEVGERLFLECLNIAHPGLKGMLNNIDRTSSLSTTVESGEEEEGEED